MTKDEYKKVMNRMETVMLNYLINSMDRLSKYIKKPRILKPTVKAMAEKFL
jgi:hypothetical protein